MFINPASIKQKLYLKSGNNSGINMSSKGGSNATVPLPSMRLRLTWQGKFFLLLLIVIFIGSMNFQNNLGMLMAVFVFYCMLISAFLAWRNVSRITLTTGNIKPVFCGNPLSIPVNLDIPRKISETPMQIQFNDNNHGANITESFLPVATQYQFTRPTRQRGRYTLNSISLISSHILGTTEVSKTTPVNREYLVYPTPANGSRHTSITEEYHRNRISLEQSDYLGQRPYMPGDSIKHINWKSFAGSKGLNTDLFFDTGEQNTWIDWYQFSSEDPELRLSHMCRIILDLSMIGQEFGMRLPGTVIQPTHGVTHRDTCLAALAAFPREQDTL